MSAPRPSLRVVAGDEAGSPYPKASLFLRCGARVVDLAVAWGLYVIASHAGMVVALLYLLFADGLLQGQSAGKRLWGIKVVYLPTRGPARFRDSVLRNAPFGLVVLLGMMPDPIGRIAFFGGALAMGGIESWKVLRDALGMRLGDAWAQTQVIDGKVVAGSTVLTRATDEARTPERVMKGREPQCASR